MVWDYARPENKIINFYIVFMVEVILKDENHLYFK